MIDTSYIVEWGTAPGEAILDHAGSHLLEAPATREPWTLQGVRVVTATVEHARSVTRPFLPPAVAQTVPGLARLWAISCDDSPIGPFASAALALVTRTKGTMRDWFVGGVTTIADPAHRASLGFPSVTGTVGVVLADGRCTVDVATEQGQLATLTLGSMAPIGTDLVGVDAVAYPVATGADAGTFRIDSVQFDGVADIAHVDRRFAMAPADDAEPAWATLLRSKWLVSASCMEFTSLIAGAPTTLIEWSRDTGWSERFEA